MKILIGDHHQLFRAGLRLSLEPFKERMAFGEVGTFDQLVDQSAAMGALRPYPDGSAHAGLACFEGIRAVRALQPDTPLVVVSASEDSATSARRSIMEPTAISLNQAVPRS